jgi:hypothetical protein
VGASLRRADGLALRFRLEGVLSAPSRPSIERSAVQPAVRTNQHERPFTLDSRYPQVGRAQRP